MSKISIVIPTLNEAENIVELLARIAAVSPSIAGTLEVIVVDDASTDGTCEAVVRNRTGLDVRILGRKEKQGGLAGAVVAGAAMARGDIVVVMDADLSHPPEKIPELVTPVIAGDCRMAIGSRYIPGGATPDWKSSRMLASRLATLAARLFCRVQDPLSGFFAVRRDLFDLLPAEIAGFKIGLALIAAAGDRLKVLEIPIVFHDRLRGASKLSGRIIVQYAAQLLSMAAAPAGRAHLSLFLGAGLIAVWVDVLFLAWLQREGAALAYAHLVSFGGAGLIHFAILHHWLFPESVFQPKRYGLLVLVWVLACFPRAGLLASLGQEAYFPPMEAFPAVCLSAMLLTVGSALMRFDGRVYPGPVWAGRGAAILATAYAILLRWAFVGGTELLHEEAYYWNYAQHLDIGYLDHPPVVAWLIHAGTSLFGDTELGVRAGAYLCWFVAAFFCYRLTRRIFDRGAALRAVMLVAVLPIFFGAGLLMTPDAPLVACWSGLLYFLYRALVDERPSAWIGAGICLGVGLLSKYTIALLAPAALLYMLADRRARHWFLRPEPYLAAVVAGVLFSPVILWNYQHDWASFVFQGTRRLSAAMEFSTHELIGSILLLLSPTGVLAALSALRQLRGMPPASSEPAPGSIDQRQALFAWIFVLAPLSVFVLFSLSKEVKLNWAGPLWLALIPFMARYMVASGSTGRWQAGLRRAWPITITAVLLLYGIALQYFALGLPGVPYPLGIPAVGRRELGRQVELLEDQIEARTGVEPLVVGMDKYETASLLAFYRPETDIGEDLAATRESVRSTAGNHLFGGKGLMYSYWFPAGNVKERVMILVSPKRNLLENPAIRQRVREAGDIQEMTAHKNGKPAARYYYSIVKGYRANEGRQAQRADAPMDSMQSGLKAGS
jgi:dolichol-phosphate mannosyltransferase